MKRDALDQHSWGRSLAARDWPLERPQRRPRQPRVTWMCAGAGSCSGIPQRDWSNKEWLISIKRRTSWMIMLKSRRKRFLSGTPTLFWCLGLSSLLFLLVSGVHAENRYWVASSASNWNSTSNWSTTSGRSGGLSFSGSSDGVYFDSARVGNCSIDGTVS